jgi:hypothetical protein
MAIVPRAVGTNLYWRELVVEEDMEILDKALVDWYPYSWLLPDELTMLKKKWFKNGLYTQIFGEEHKTRDQVNADFKNNKGLNENSFTHVVAGNFLKSNDTCIGISKGCVNRLHYFHELVAFDPAYRGEGYFKERNIIGQKVLFEVYKMKSNTIKIPILPSIENAENAGLVASIKAVNHSQGIRDLIEIEQVTGAGRATPLQYSVQKMTREEWGIWINLPENAEYKNADFTWEWEFTV